MLTGGGREIIDAGLLTIMFILDIIDSNVLKIIDLKNKVALIMAFSR